MEHPYVRKPRHSFWAKSVSRDYSPSDLYQGEAPLVRAGERVMSAGSCFAAELVPYLEKNGIEYVRTEGVHTFYQAIEKESLSYDRFSAAYGNVYTARQMLQLLQRAMGEFQPVEDRWHQGRLVTDPFRPGLKYPALSDCEFDALTAQHLRAVLEAVRLSDVFIFTFGLTEAWVSVEDGSVYPACPGTIAGEFDERKYRFHNFTVDEVVGDVLGLIDKVRSIKPGIRVILTVSPVPLVATATGEHVIVASSYSKAVLRAAAAAAAAARPDVVYFPSYEIVTGPYATEDYREANKRGVTRKAVDQVMRVFIDHCRLGGEGESRRFVASVGAGAKKAASATSVAAALSANIAAIECEEQAVELGG